jgi:hypothetical protein
MSYIFFIVFVAIVVTAAFRMYRKRSREAQLRHLVKTQAVTYMTSVVVRQRDELWGSEFGLRGPMNLIVRVGFIEVSCPISVLAAAFGMEFYFPAAAVTIETSRNRWGREWIRLTGESAGKVIQLSIADRKNMRADWDALVGAGAVPTGVPPVSLKALRCATAKPRSSRAEGIPATEVSPAGSANDRPAVWLRHRDLAEAPVAVIASVQYGRRPSTCTCGTGSSCPGPGPASPWSRARCGAPPGA